MNIYVLFHDQEPKASYSTPELAMRAVLVCEGVNCVWIPHNTHRSIWETAKDAFPKPYRIVEVPFLDKAPA